MPIRTLLPYLRTVDPHGIVYRGHPLFGTVDHVRPLSLGGKDVFENRKPAHYLCNQIKGNQRVLSDKEVERCQIYVVIYLRKHGTKVSDSEIEAARERIKQATIELSRFGREAKRYAMKNYHIDRWNDDGGYVCIQTEGFEEIGGPVMPM